GARTGARAGILLAAACLLGIAVAARGYPALVLLLAAGAAANGLGQLAANATLAAVPAHRQGLSFGIKQAAIPTATLLAGASVPAVALTIGWRRPRRCPGRSGGAGRPQRQRRPHWPHCR